MFWNERGSRRELTVWGGNSVGRHGVGTARVEPRAGEAESGIRAAEKRGRPQWGGARAQG